LEVDKKLRRLIDTFNGKVTLKRKKGVERLGKGTDLSVYSHLLNHLLHLDHLPKQLCKGYSMLHKATA
jgi:hypothetical protein